MAKAKPHHKLIQSYLDGHTTYNAYTLNYDPQNPYLGTVDCHISLPPHHHKNCSIYLGQIALAIIIVTTEPFTHTTHHTADYLINYADPQLKTKLQQIIQQYQEHPTPQCPY